MNRVGSFTFITMKVFCNEQMATIIGGAFNEVVDPYHYYPTIDDWYKMPERLRQCLIALLGHVFYEFGAPILGVIATGYLLTACL